MRLRLAADVDTNQAGESDILTIGDPVRILALDTQTVFAYLVKLRCISRVVRDRNKLFVPTGKLITIARGLGLFECTLECRGRPLPIHLSSLHAVNDPSDHSASFGNDLALLQKLTANIAISITGIAVLCEGSILSITDDWMMSLCRNFLCATSTSLQTEQCLPSVLPGSGAGRLDCRVNDHGVPLGGDFFQAGKDRTANRALRAGLMAGLGAGGRFFGDLNRRVAGRADGLCFCLIAASCK